jgi:hypothetical protein
MELHTECLLQAYLDMGIIANLNKSVVSRLSLPYERLLTGCTRMSFLFKYDYRCCIEVHVRTLYWRFWQGKPVRSWAGLWVSRFLSICSLVPKQCLQVASTRGQLTSLFSDASCVQVVRDKLVTSSLGTSLYTQYEAAGCGDEWRLRLVCNVSHITAFCLSARPQYHSHAVV